MMKVLDPCATTSLAQRLERGELVLFSPCPFTLPEGEARALFLRQQLRSSKKNISYNPTTGTVSGHVFRSSDEARRLCEEMAAFSKQARRWLASVLPTYAASMKPDRASYRPEEEAVRKLRRTARNDLLHIDAFPSRPTQGWRLLRLFVNINPSEARVWATSDTLVKILHDYGRSPGFPRDAHDGLMTRFGQGLLGLFQPGSKKRTQYDRLMLRLHHFLKTNDKFQEQAPRRFWHFAPNSAWLMFTDGVSHAELRGRHALEHSFFISPAALECPELSPAAELEKALGIPMMPRAA